MINTFSRFYYIEDVTINNFYLDFDEGVGELTAEVESGERTPSDLADAIASAMNLVGAQVYTVTFNRSNRSYTISSTGNFTLNVATGTHLGADIFSLIGFTGSDLSGSNSYTGSPAASYYDPQFKLQNPIGPEDLQKAISPAVNKSASGEIEVVRFGIEKFYEFNINFITNVDQKEFGFIKTNLTGLEDARLFLRFITTKRKIEFMEDIDDLNTFVTLILESTEEDAKGTGYRLKELYDQGLVDYYETGKLVFRLVE